ncbi:hypothetical protein GcM3_135021, partial [Golovinomyces cichoracearum]
MNESRDFTSEGLKGFKPLSQSNYIEWRDMLTITLILKIGVEGLPTNANDDLRAKSARIAVVLKTAAGTQRTYLLGLRTPKDILAKLEEVNGGSSKGTLSSLQRQFSSPDSTNK